MAATTGPVDGSDRNDLGDSPTAVGAAGIAQLRSLPLRHAPIDGEAIDSWLESYAHRARTPWGDMLSAVGLEFTASAVLSPTAEALARTSTATGVPMHRLQAMTLRQLHMRALRIDSSGVGLSRAFPWGKAASSRYCPDCLAETNGRWQLRWRSGWSFACTRHARLLVDHCPQCGRRQRERTVPADLVPQPGCCARASEAGGQGRSPSRCGADLTSVEGGRLSPDSPMIQAQQTINDLIDTDRMFGVYLEHPQPCASVLADVRAIASRILTYAVPELKTITGTDRADIELMEQLHVTAGTRRPAVAAPQHAIAAAIGTAAALSVLGEATIPDAAKSMRWLVTAGRERGQTITASNSRWGLGVSDTLRAVQLSALSPQLAPTDQIRYRTGSAWPADPTRTEAGCAALAARLPHLLWSEWAVPLGTGTDSRARAAFSMSMLLAGSRATPLEAATLLGSPMSGAAARRILTSTANRESWPQVLTALSAMADELHRSPPPIDYSRRRSLDFSGLLTASQWRSICRRTGTSGPYEGRRRTARGFLIERLTGSKAETTNEFDKAAIENFPLHLTADRLKQLDSCGLAYLADNGISGEPIVWAPPTDMLRELDLPGPSTEDIDLEALHHFVNEARNRRSIGQTASDLNISGGLLRHTLEVAPPQRTHSATESKNGAYARAARHLPEAKLRAEYEGKNRTQAEIASSVSVSRQVLSRLMDDYGIAPRRAIPRAKVEIDPSWLHKRYVDDGCSLKDLAAETGVSPTTLAVRAKRAGIQLRPQGAWSHRSYRTLEKSILDEPEILRPALTDPACRDRLERLVAIAYFRTLREAAAALGTTQPTLSAQIRQVEAQTGESLFTRAMRGHPMRPTEFGTRLIDAIVSRRTEWHLDETSAQLTQVGLDGANVRAPRPAPA